MEAVAKLRNHPTSPRKMRLLVDLIRGMKVDKALAELEHNPKDSAVPLRKLVLSAIDNWKQKNEGGDESQLVVKTIMVDGGRTLKRMRPCLLYTSDAADERSSVDLGGRRIIKKKNRLQIVRLVSIIMTQYKIL